MPGRISGTIETILRRGACAFRRRPAPVRVRPVPTPTTNWVLSLTRDANVARLANRETVGTEGLSPFGGRAARPTVPRRRRYASASALITILRSR